MSSTDEKENVLLGIREKLCVFIQVQAIREQVANISELKMTDHMHSDGAMVECLTRVQEQGVSSHMLKCLHVYTIAAS